VVTGRVAAAWFDYDKDGRLDLFVVNYVKWAPDTNRFCGDQARGVRIYCHPRFFEGLPDRFVSQSRRRDVRRCLLARGISAHVGKGMSAAIADFDHDGQVDIFVTNDTVPDFLFRNKGDGSFEDIALLAGVSVPASGRPVVEYGSRLSGLRQRWLGGYFPHRARRRDISTVSQRRPA
jgi:hypothetical protein